MREKPGPVVSHRKLKRALRQFHTDLDKRKTAMTHRIADGFLGDAVEVHGGAVMWDQRRRLAEKFAPLRSIQIRRAPGPCSTYHR